MERRKGRRIKRRALCEFVADGEYYRGVIVDTSPDGLFVETDAWLRRGTPIELRLTASASLPAVTVRAEVIRRRSVPAVLSSIIRKGLGLRILDAPAEYYAELGEDRAAEAANDPGEAPASAPGPPAAPGEADPAALTGDFRSESTPPPPETRGSGQAAQTDLPARYDRTPARDGWISPQAPEPSSAIVIDSGELDEVIALLRELGTNPVRHRVRDSSGFRGWERPPLLLVAAARSALSFQVPSGAEAEGVVTIAIGEDDSQTLCALMRRQGFQYVVRRPVHPEALRLLFLRALYRDRDQRREPRFPFGYQVTWRSRWRRRRAALLDISPRGCRLSAGRRSLAPGARVTVRIPREVADGRALVLRGRVARTESQTLAGEPGRTLLGVVFKDLSPKTQERLGALLTARSIGPATLPRPRTRAPTPRPVEPSQAPESGTASRDRRRSPRGALRQEVVSLDEQADRVMHVLVGRDLSVGGIRVEPHPTLGVGDRLRLAIYDASCPAPVIVDATVVRDDADFGLGMRFTDVSDDAARYIERIVATLPAIEALRAADTPHQGVVLGEILEKRALA